MKSVIVKTEKDLKTAMNDKNVNEIEIQNADLVKKIKVLSKIKKTTPWLIGAICIAIPLIPFTGGSSLVPVLGASMASGIVAAGATAGTAGATAGTTSVLTIVGLCVAIGGTLVIALFTDWEEVEIGNFIKLKRKAK